MDSVREMEVEEGGGGRVIGPRGGVGGHFLVMLLASILSTAGGGFRSAADATL